VKLAKKMIEIEKCPVCSKNSFSHYLDTEDYFFTKEKFSLSKCDSCGFVFTNPVPELKKIGDYYETDKYLSHNSDGGGLVSSIYKIVREQNLKNKYSVITRYKSEGSVLDIGSGTGEFLNYLKKRKWNTKGIEPSKNAREFAKQNYNIDVDKETGLTDIANASFDVLTMWHVLEHVYNLDERMKTIFRVLKNDGIAIIALPMIDSPDSMRYGKYWAGLDVPRHLYHFCSRTFEILAKKYNLEIIDKYPMKFDSLYVSWLSHQAMDDNLPLFRGVLNGLKSNAKADRNSNYSSMIFVLNKTS
jgi:2-polyprenyl-3-methyl-5-hydroxy-6-metoxy-1,4-benzoquinol methylase